MRPRHFFAALVVAASIGGCGGSPAGLSSEQSLELIEARTHFTYKGKPIPPFFLADFNGGPGAGEFWTRGAGARISRVVVEGLIYDDEEHSEGSYNDCSFTDGGDGVVIFDLSNSEEDEGGAGWLSYKFLGTTPSGITVLEYLGNTGGSGTFHGVMFIRFEIETIGYNSDVKEDRLVMQYLGEECWGDRVFRDVELVGNELRLGPTKSDIPDEQEFLQPACAIPLE